MSCNTRLCIAALAPGSTREAVLPRGAGAAALDAGVFEPCIASQMTRDGLHPDQAADHRSVFATSSVARRTSRPASAVRTARYRNLVTPKPDAVSDAELALSLLPVGFVLLWPWLRMIAGAINQ